MDRETHDRAVALYWDIRERAEAEAEAEYLRLQQITQELEGNYEAAVSGLSEDQRQAVELYITARESLNRRVLEVACEEFARLK